MSHRPIRVLVLDDEIEIVELLTESLSYEGAFEVMGFHDPNQALEVLKKKKFDVIVSDVKMPKMNGVQFIRALRKQEHIATPVIFLSGFTDLSSGDAIEVGASCLLPKPWDYPSLEAQIKKLAQVSTKF